MTNTCYKENYVAILKCLNYPLLYIDFSNMCGHIFALNIHVNVNLFVVKYNLHGYRFEHCVYMKPIYSSMLEHIKYL